jgi:hypothetical protein
VEFNPGVAGGIAGVAFVLSFVLGIANGADFLMAVLKALGFGALFFVLTGIASVILKMTMKTADSTESSEGKDDIVDGENVLGTHIDLSVGDDNESTSDILREVDELSATQPADSPPDTSATDVSAIDAPSAPDDVPPPTDANAPATGIDADAAQIAPLEAVDNTDATPLPTFTSPGDMSAFIPGLVAKQSPMPTSNDDNNTPPPQESAPEQESFAPSFQMDEAPEEDVKMTVAKHGKGAISLEDLGSNATPKMLAKTVRTILKSSK